VVSASNELASTLVDTMSRGASRYQSSNRSSGRAVSSVEEIGQSADRIRAISDQVSSTTGLTSAQVAQIAFQLSGGAGLPGISPIKASATGSAGKSYSNNLTVAEQKVANELTTDQLREFKSFADRASREQSYVSALAKEDRDGQELASRLSSGTTRVESAQSVYAQRQSVANRLSTAYESGEALSIDLAQLPANSDFMQRYQRLASEYGPNSLALQAAMASELATRALPPTKSPSASALPATFADILGVRNHDLRDPVFAPDAVAAADRANDRAAGPRLSGNDPKVPEVPTGLAGVRGDVSDRAATRAGSAGDTFDTRNEITRNPDGTISTRRSQMLGNARQLREDVANMAENASDLVAAGSEQALSAAAAARARNSESQRSRDIAATPDVPTMLPKGGRRKR
jgi:conjugal transfer mating pair stabilization protein TraG